MSVKELLGLIFFWFGVGVALHDAVHHLYLIGGYKEILAPQGLYIGFLLLILGYLLEVDFRGLKTLLVKIKSIVHNITSFVHLCPRHNLLEALHLREFKLVVLATVLLIIGTICLSEINLMRNGFVEAETIEDIWTETWGFPVPWPPFVVRIALQTAFDIMFSIVVLTMFLLTTIIVYLLSR